MNLDVPAVPLLQANSILTVKEAATLLKVSHPQASTT
jgi:hypothetical protein